MQTTDTTSEKNNKLIAEFMGWQVNWQLAPDEDWSQLMPVVEKCLCSPEDDSRDFDFHYDAIHDALWSINIEATYKAVVEFIKWYNENNKS